MPNRQEALKIAEQLKIKKKEHELIDLLTPFYNEKQTIDVACYLIYAYRRLNSIDKCYEICDEMEIFNGQSARINTQRKWCNLFEKVIYCSDISIAAKNGELIFNNLNQSNNYDFYLAKFLCFHLSDIFRNLEMYKDSYSWLLKINSFKLSNRVVFFVNDDEASFENEERRRHSEKYMYYYRLAALINNPKVFDEALTRMLNKYNSQFKIDFINAVKNKINYNSGMVNLWALANVLMALKEEDTIMNKSVEKTINHLVVSDISNYVFCPVSCAISKSLFDVDSLTAIDLDERLEFQRKKLNDFYEIYKNSNDSNIYNSFKDSIEQSFRFNESDLIIIKRILNSKRLGQNVPNGIFQSFSFQNNDISGSPDMVLQDNEKFLVEEVYTSSHLNNFSKPFENDLIKMVGYLTEMNINFGYLLYWNTITVTIENTYTKKALITGVKIFKIDKQNYLVEKYKGIKNKVKTFLNNRSISFRSTELNYNKCISCSSIYYCKHKRGNLNNLNLAYKNHYMTD